MTHNNSQKGFTLIELLVVIAIIGTLASVVLSSLDTARGKARDSKRSAEIGQIGKALQLYWTDNDGQYPPHNAGTQVLSSLTELTAGGHMQALPVDPTEGDTATGYRYARQADGTAFTLLVRFEEDSYASWCGLSVNGGFTAWSGAGWYRDISDPICK